MYKIIILNINFKIIYTIQLKNTINKKNYIDNRFMPEVLVLKTELNKKWQN